MKWMPFLAKAAVLLPVGAASLQAQAGAPVPFTLDPARSSISLSGTVQIVGVGTFAVQPQGAGSLTTSYSGSLLAELTPPTLRFVAGGQVVANNNGTWQPASGGAAGSAPANYGGLISPPFTTGYSAGRNIRVGLASPTVGLTNGGFDASLLVVTYLTNTAPVPSMDFRVSSFLPGQSTNGTALLMGSSTNSPSVGYLTNETAGLLTLVLPVNTTNVSTSGSYIMTTVLQGQIVATAPASAWPLALSLQAEAGQVTLAWPSLPGQKFTVQTTSSLGGAWTAVPGTLTATAGTTTWTTNVVRPMGFYRVVGQF